MVLDINTIFVDILGRRDYGAMYGRARLYTRKIKMIDLVCFFVFLMEVQSTRLISLYGLSHIN